MHPSLIEEFRRLRDNAGDKREKLLRIAFKQTRLRKRLNITAGVLALLSAASITALLGDFTSARAMKILAALFSTASGLISLMVNTGYKDSELSELNIGAAGYLNLRERAHRIPLNPSIDDVQAYTSLSELQDLYGELDVKFQRYVVIERWAEGAGARGNLAGAYRIPMHRDEPWDSEPINNQLQYPGGTGTPGAPPTSGPDPYSHPRNLPRGEYGPSSPTDYSPPTYVGPGPASSTRRNDPGHPTDRDVKPGSERRERQPNEN